MKCSFVEKGLCFFLLLAFCFVAPAQIFAGDTNTKKTFRVQARDNTVNVDVEDAELSDVLKEIGLGTGVKVTTDSKLIRKRVSAKFEDKDTEGALREVLRGHFYRLEYSQDPLNRNKSILREVKVKSDIMGTKPLKGQLVKVSIPYGTGKGEVDIYVGSEGDFGGPLSYTVDSNDNVLILDALSNRVQMYSSMGKYVSTIPLKKIDGGSSPIDIVADRFGFFYVYDGVNKLYQYDKKGNVFSYITVDDNIRPGMGPMTIVNNEIFIGGNGCDAEGRCRKDIMGRIGPDKRLVNPTEEATRTPREERRFQSGRIYKGRKYVEGNNRELNIFDEKGILSQTLSTPYEGVLTRDILGEDKRGNVYFQIRTVENEDRLYNIDEFSASGDYIGTTQIPGGTLYGYPTVKEFIVSENGNIYYYRPEEDSLKLSIFLNQANQ